MYRLASVKKVHPRKLHKLGIGVNNTVDANKVILNLPDKGLSNNDPMLLCLGAGLGVVGGVLYAPLRWASLCARVEGGPVLEEE